MNNERLMQVKERLRLFGGVFFLINLLSILYAAVWLWQVLAGGNPDVQDLGHLLDGPSWVHWLGTDDMGRDILARLAHATGASLLVAFGVGSLVAVVGVSLGFVAGWRGGWVNRAFDFACDVVLALPGLLVALMVSALMQPRLLSLILILGLLGWVGMARMTRAQVMILKEMPYIRAARLGGVGKVRLFFAYILPNMAAPLAVESMLVMVGAMAAEAGLSFLGLGIPAPLPSLGGMIRDGVRYLLMAPHMVLAPAVVLICLTVGLNLLARGLRKA